MATKDVENGRPSDNDPTENGQAERDDDPNQEGAAGLCRDEPGYVATLKVPEVVRTLQLGRNKVYEMLEAREIPGRRFGRTWRIPRERFFRWLNGGGPA